jgi:N-acetylneuraminic acid mutarotase
MLRYLWLRCCRQLSRNIYVNKYRCPAPAQPRCRLRLEELESRLAPASYAVNSQLQITRLGEPGALSIGDVSGTSVVFFESGVADYQVLRQGLPAGTDAVVLDGGGDGIREMAAFLASRHDLMAVGVVAHGASGRVALGTTELDLENLGSYARELSVIGYSLRPGGELDLWSCDVAAGPAGAALARGLAVATGTGVAASEHAVGSPSQGGTWQLNVRIAGARGQVPFSAAAQGAFHVLLGTTIAAATMSTERAYYTATLLNNGKVLVAGGQSNSGYVASAELYDPTTNTWSSAGSMATARFLHTATLLANGKVLVAGGYGTSGILSSAELYDPASNTWSAAGSMTTARDLHGAALLANGMVLVMGGYNGGVLSSAELYDPASNSWSSTAAMTTAREQFTTTLLTTGKVLVAGGIDSGFNSLASTELYDPTSNTWSAAAPMASPRYLQTATLIGNGKVLVTGGVDNNRTVLASAELYDPVSNSWSGAGSMVSPRDQHAATLLNTGDVLVTGGQTNVYLATTELYDPVQNTWSAGDSLLTARASHTVTLLTNGQVLIAGGISNSGVLSSTELYNPGAAAQPGKFQVNVLGGNTVTAGSSFLVTAQAVDQFGNPVSNYNGPSSVTITSTPSDPSGSLPITGTLNGSGFGFLQGSLNKAVSYTLTATAGTFTGTSSAFTVTPAGAAYFTVAAPATATTGCAFNITVSAFDRFANSTPGYTGTISITSTDPAASVLFPSYTFTAGDNGVHTFSVMLNSSTLSSGIGATIIVRDVSATSPPIIGLSAPVSVQGLVVAPGGFQKTTTGFTVTFSKPFTLADLTMYGSNTTTVQDVTMVGADLGNGPFSVPGTLYQDPTTPNTLVFKASSAYLLAINQGIGVSGDNSVALPDDTYTVTLVSGLGTNGFMDALGTHLDGLTNGTAANYTQTFATTFQDDVHANANPVQVLGIPDFARGPDGATTIKVPNDTAQGIPITLYNTVNVQDVTFTLTYNPALLTVAGGGTGDGPVGSSFVMGAVTANTATFTYHNDTPLSGTVVLGDILASVPDSAATIYKSKELLTLSGISVTGGATVQAANGIHVDAYLGDVHVTAAPAIDASDALDALKVASGAATGFSAYTLLDPAIIGNFVAGHLSVDPASVTALFTRAAHLPVPQLPNIPAAATTVSVGGADPTLSLLGGVQPNGIVSVQVMLDQPHPAGSTGMTEAHLALTYDPSVLSVSARAITLGSMPGLGSGWQVSSEVDATTGQIGITLYNLTGTPITDSQAGSLVQIAFHVVPGAAAPWATVQLVSEVSPNGQRLVTELDDDQGPLTLSPGMDHLLVKLGSKGK